MGSRDHRARPVRGLRARVAADASARAARAAAADIHRADAVREGRRDLPAIADGPRLRLGDARRAGGPRVRHAGGTVRAGVAGELARYAGGARADPRACMRQRAAGESVFRRRAGRLASGPLSALQRPRTLARLDVALCGAGLACVFGRAGVAHAEARQRLTSPVAIIDRTIGRLTPFRRASEPFSLLSPDTMDSFYKYHLFFCINQREPGADRPSCANVNSPAMQEYAKKRVKTLGLAGPGQVRINKSACLDRCEEGPTIVVYPEGTWYTYGDKSDIDETVASHFVHGKVSELLNLDASASTTTPHQMLKRRTTCSTHRSPYHT